MAVSHLPLKIGIFEERTPGYWQGKHESVADSGCLRVSQILVNKASGDSVLQVLGNKARKKYQIIPFLPMHRGTNWTIAHIFADVNAGFADS